MQHPTRPDDLSACSATTLEKAGFCIAAASASAYGFTVNVLGTRRKETFDEFGALDKLWALKEFVETIPDHPDVIIAFMDGYGSIFIFLSFFSCDVT